jgi:RES domain-containing protein
MPALYTSLRMETAWLEAQQAFPFKAQPLTICAYDVDCADVADLTDHLVRGELAIDPADMACPWEDMASRRLVPPSWELTRRLAERGIAGIIAPSFAPGATAIDRNVIFWRWSDALPHRVVVVDDEGRLPRNNRSWT